MLTLLQEWAEWSRMSHLHCAPGISEFIFVFEYLLISGNIHVIFSNCCTIWLSVIFLMTLLIKNFICLSLKNDLAYDLNLFCICYTEESIYKCRLLVDGHYMVIISYITAINWSVSHVITCWLPHIAAMSFISCWKCLEDGCLKFLTFWGIYVSKLYSYV